MTSSRDIMTSLWRCSVRRCVWLVVLGGLLSFLSCPPALAARRRLRQGRGRKRWQEGDVRLVRGRGRHEGIVLLYHQGRWGGVCDDMWDVTDSDVVCRQRGFPGSARPALKTEFGARARRRLWITRVQCQGTEKRLLDCGYVGWGRRIRHMCQGDWRAVGVVCKPKVQRNKNNKNKPANLRQPHSWLARRKAAARKKALLRKFAKAGKLKKTENVPQTRQRANKKPLAGSGAKTNGGRNSLTDSASNPDGGVSSRNRVPLRPWAIIDAPRRRAGRRQKPKTTTAKPTAAKSNTNIPKVIQSATTKPITSTSTSTTSTKATTTTTRSTTTTTPTTTTSTTAATKSTTTSKPTSPTTTTPTTTLTTTTPTTTKPTTTTTTPTTTTPTTTTTIKPTTTTTTSTTTKATTMKPTTTTTIAKPTTTKPKTTTTATTTTTKKLTTTLATPTTTEKSASGKDADKDPKKTDKKIVDLSKVKSSGGITLKDTELQSQDALLLQADSPGNPDLELRLEGGRYTWEGRLELRERALVPGDWGTVCGARWGIKETMVVCRQLGMNYAKQPLQTNYFGGEDKTKVFYSFSCTGRESSLSQCTMVKSSVEYTCPKDTMVAGVVCATYLPDLIPDLRRLSDSVRLQDRPLYYLQCALEENCLSSSAYHLKNNSRNWRNSMRRLLRFSTIVHNRGDADFRPYVAKGQWQWHTCHMHFHSMEVFAHYDILDENGTRLAEGSKASFCLEDTHCDRGVRRQFQCAGFGDQGLSVNCSDNYLWDIDCQWIDITDIEPGSYTFLLEVNPQMRVAELSFDNNIASCDLYYSGYFAKLSNCVHKSLLDYNR